MKVKISKTQWKTIGIKTGWIKQVAQDVFERHRKRIALDTLKMSEVGASVMGGMNKKEAIGYLRSIGYADQKLTNLLTDAGHSHDEINALLN